MKQSFAIQDIWNLSSPDYHLNIFLYGHKINYIKEECSEMP